jgi:hypothetical protein
VFYDLCIQLISPITGLSPQSGKLTLRSGSERGDGDSIDVKTQQELQELKDQGQAKEIFEKCVTQKKNIYSMDPIPLNNPWTFWVDRYD